jgi:hypothetical protein
LIIIIIFIFMSCIVFKYVILVDDNSKEY